MTFFSSRRRDETKTRCPNSKRWRESGATAIRYRNIGEKHEYQVSAGAFFQVNRHLIDELVSVVTGDARGESCARPICWGGAVFARFWRETFITFSM